MGIQSNTLFWLIFFITTFIGFVQLFAYYGKGRQNQKIEYGSFVLILCTFIYALVKLNFLGFISLIVLFLITNTIVGKYVAQRIHIKLVGYVPRLREEYFQELFKKKMSVSEKVEITEIEKAALEYSKRIRIF